jgi:hypothetical protein
MKHLTSLYIIIAAIASAVAAPPSLLADQAPSTAQCLKLRKQYAAQFRTGWFTDPTRRGVMDLYAKDKKAFAAKSEQWLRHCPIDAKVHAMRALVLTEPNQASQKQYHQAMFSGLMESLFNSGDGKTCKTAYHAINVNEEYMVLDWIHAKAAGHDSQGGCDVFNVQLEGKPAKIYFDVSGSL